MINEPIRNKEILKVANAIHIGDIIKRNAGGNAFERLMVTGIYPNFVRTRDESGYNVCLRWDDVVLKYRKGWISH